MLLTLWIILKNYRILVIIDFLYLHNKTASTDNNEFVPNFKGKTLKEALRMANKKGIILSPNSISGKIIWQSIKPGEKFSNHKICQLKLKI